MIMTKTQGQLHPLLTCVLLSIALFTGIWLARLSEIWLPSELYWFDQFLRLRTDADHLDERFLLIGIQESDINQFGWPLSDEIIANALQEILNQNPSMVGLDLYREQPRPPGYEKLTAIFKGNNRVIAVMKFQDSKGQKVPPPPVLEKSNRATFSDLVVDTDSVVRRGLLFLDDGTTSVTSFALRLALGYLKKNGISAQKSAENPEFFQLGATTIPPIEANDGSYVNLDARGYQFLLDYRSTFSPSTGYSLQDLFSGRIPHQAIENRIVILGTAADSIKDQFLTPYSRAANSVQPYTFGMNIHAQASSQLVRLGMGESTLLRHISDLWEAGWIWIWTLLGGGAGLWSGYAGRSFVRLPMAMLGGGSLLGLICFIALNQGWWLPFFPSILGFLASFLLITAHVAYLRRIQLEAAQRIKESEERVRLLLESVGEGVLGVDLNGHITFANTQAILLLGYPLDNLLGQNAHEHFHHTHTNGTPYPQESCWWHKTMADGKAYHIENEIFWRQDGSCIDIEYRSTPIKKGNNWVGAVISFSDISERKRIQRQRDEALEVVSSSIRYASRIQRSVLPDIAILQQICKEYFVLWNPRDTVGGDIYWCDHWGDGILLILGDCTGHGVPGAFMTLIVIGAIGRAKGDVPTGDIAALIGRMHQIIQITLGQHTETGESDDGIELGLCYIPSSKDKMFYSGARFDLYILENGNITEIKGSKKGIGYRGIAATQIYHTHEILFSYPSKYYLTTDGLIDQIGGTNRRAFGKNRFKELLLSIQEISLTDQKTHIQQALLEYQGVEQRRDDVSVIGFQIV
ncbi:MAG: CHASE2 domain-containing protein [Magnetococcus sp. DMHC-6]